MAVRTEVRDDGILLATIDNPPVNALGAEVRAGVEAALDRIDADASIKAMVLTGIGGFFSAGADIREFGQPPKDPSLPDLLARLEQCRVPTVAAINGTAMGGGLETALACRYRLAPPNASLALPEVKLGLIPGAGGTQRLPRVIGVLEAAEIVTSGVPINAGKAHKLGLIDELFEGDILETALVFARGLVDAQPRPPLSETDAPTVDAEVLEAFTQKLKRRVRGQLSPLKALEAVRAAADLPFGEGMKRERQIFLDCLESDQRKGLIHAFFAERAVGKIPALKDVAPRHVDVIAMLGAGTMGAGIAIAAAQAGYNVSIFDANADALAAGVNRIGKTITGAAEKGRMTNEAAEAAISRVTPVNAIEGLAEADLYIEAIIEDMDVKKNVFKTLAEISKPGAVLASNTSYLDINDIGEASGRSESVIGMHFFSPANIMRLLEVIKTDKAAPDVLATALSVGKRLGKISVLAGVCDGFIGNRIFKKYRQQAEYLVEDGARPQDVDRVMREFGFAMGPFEVSDLAGIDIGWRNRRREDATRDPAERYVDIVDRLYDLGRLGQKTGAGWYRYEKGDRTPHPDPVVDEVIAEAIAAKGAARRDIADEEIRNRILFAMINEGAKILEEGIAQRPLDIDVVFLNGYGFPAYRGGPMFHADAVGLDKVVAVIKEYAKGDAYAWRIAPLLEDCVRRGVTFSSFNNP